LGEVSNFLRGFDGAVLVAADGGFQHFGEGALLDEIFLQADFQIPSLAGAGEGGAAG
jgi:hypothetical protein